MSRRETQSMGDGPRSQGLYQTSRKPSMTFVCPIGGGCGVEGGVAEYAPIPIWQPIIINGRSAKISHLDDVCLIVIMYALSTSCHPRISDSL